MTNEVAYQELVSINNLVVSNYLSVDDCDIYHYTSPMGLNGIISNNSLRFTDRNYLNDYSEGRYVIELCLNSKFELKLPKEHRGYFKEYCQKLYNTPSKKKRYVYQCSFSIQDDNLALWNYYTKNDGIKGYNLGFSSKDLSQKLLTRSVEEKHSINVFHGKIIYSKNIQKSIIKNIVNDFKGIIEKNRNDFPFCKLAIELLVEKIIFIGAFFKDQCFAHEREYRLVLHLTPYWDIEEKCVKFMILHKSAKTYEKCGLMVPYIDIKFSKDVLKSISTSPTLSFGETESNLINALKLYGYNAEKIKITKSNIPIRY